MKKALISILALAALAALPLAAAAPAPPTPVAPLAAPAALAAPAVPATPPADTAPALALSPLDGALAMAGDCCVSLRQQCEANCRHKQGVSEFTCFPDVCMASCFCNVFP